MFPNKSPNTHEATLLALYQKLLAMKTKFISSNQKIGSLLKLSNINEEKGVSPVTRPCQPEVSDSKNQRLLLFFGGCSGMGCCIKEQYESLEEVFLEVMDHSFTHQL